MSWIDTNVLNNEERGELVGSSITQDDLAKHPDEVKEVARFSMNLKLSSRQSVDTFIHDSIWLYMVFKYSCNENEKWRSSESLFWMAKDW